MEEMKNNVEEQETQLQDQLEQDMTNYGEVKPGKF